jgi:hypothetical protein
MSSSQMALHSPSESHNSSPRMQATASAVRFTAAFVECLPQCLPADISAFVDIPLGETEPLLTGITLIDSGPSLRAITRYMAMRREMRALSESAPTGSPPRSR